MADETTGAEDIAVAKKPGLLDNKLVLVAIVVAVQAGLGFAGAKFLLAPKVNPGVESAMRQAESGGQRTRGPLVSLEEMVVSLNATGRGRYLRTNIALEAEDEATAALVAERIAEFRDAAIMRLSRHTPDELISFEGKEAVKAEIKQELKQILQDGELLNVYFSDFVVQ